MPVGGGGGGEDIMLLVSIALTPAAATALPATSPAPPGPPEGVAKELLGLWCITFVPLRIALLVSEDKDRTDSVAVSVKDGVVVGSECPINRVGHRERCDSVKLSTYNVVRKVVQVEVVIVIAEGIFQLFGTFHEATIHEGSQ
ncbi:4336_t:CDS:2 [Acaulospora colombiana]|uniref:4336_t:CDS:1 n=1 Tax=Acaulospora colombiana TaxID=27376 RepID=A0ACA9N4Z2_9GLOM|nr:4336_t:CDS:2 [Acaulospora colombiana]